MNQFELPSYVPVMDGTFAMRKPCTGCQYPYGRIVKKSDQNCVYCAQCNKYAGYNAPKRETGEEQRHVSSRPGLKPNQRARIVERDNSQCVLCGRSPARDGIILHVGHVLSVDDGERIGAKHEELWDDDNLYTSCEECNLGQGKLSLPPRMALSLLRARMHHRDMKAGRGK